MFSLAALPVALLFLGSADPGQPASLRLAALPPDPDLGRLLWERAPDLAAARARVATARAQIVRTETLPNPTLDLSWNTIPVGETNPPGLSSRLGSVPNYAVGLTQPFEIRKRGPRQRAARYGAEATLWDAADQLRQTWLDFLAVAGRIASSEQRMAALSGLVEDAAKLTELQHRRAEKGDAAALEFERARLEEERLCSSLAEERHKLAVALTDCARLTGAACEPFGSAERAQAFFDNAVVDIDVYANQEVAPGRDKPLVQISDLEEVLVLADVAENDSADVQQGAEVEIRAQGGTVVRQGKVEHVSEVVDPQRRAVEVRIRVANGDRALRPNSLVEILFSPPAAALRVRVPSSAVVTDGEKSVVFVAKSPSRLERVPVTLGRQRDGEVELLAGLAPGTRYVSSSALLLLNEVELAD